MHCFSALLLFSLAVLALCVTPTRISGPDGSEYVQLEELVEPTHPLWPGSLYTYEDRDKAMLRGIAFLEKQSANDDHFLQHARDYMLGMKLVSQSSHNRQIITSATRVGRDMAQRWQNAHKDTDPATLSNDDLRLLTGDIFNGKRYNVDVAALMERLRNVLKERKFSSFFAFNPIVGPPQDSFDAKTGRTISRWEHWQNALIFAYVLKELDVQMLEGDGERLFIAVLSHLPKLKPHTHVMDTAHFIPNLSAVLQLVYTLSDYEFLSLDRTVLPDEYTLLEQSLPVAIDYFRSVEAVGEIVDCLKTFGDKESSPSMQRGITFLLAEQNADGSWGGEQEKSMGIEHHTTIVALWGLRERLQHGAGPRGEKISKLLEEQKKSNPSQLASQLHANHFANNLANMLQMMGMPFNVPPGGVGGVPTIPGMQIPGMPHNPFSNFHTQFTGSGNAPIFELNDAQRKYMEMQMQQQQAFAKHQEAMQAYYAQMYGNYMNNANNGNFANFPNFANNNGANFANVNSNPNNNGNNDPNIDANNQQPNVQQ